MTGTFGKAIGLGAVVIVLFVGGAAYYMAHAPKEHAPGQVPLEPIDAASARADVIALAGVDPGELSHLLEPDAAISQFAERAAEGKNTPDARAQAIMAAISARREAQAFVEWPRAEPRVDPPLTAAETFARVQRDGAREQLYPLEVTALAVAALRSLNVPALVAEVYGYASERKPLDPSGRMGYCAVFVPSGKVSGTIYDVYGGRTAQPSAADYAVLNDAQAIGASLVLRALRALRNQVDDSSAGHDADAAVALLPKSPTSHGIRAAVLLVKPETVEAGRTELEAARSLRDDGVRHNNLAVNALARQDALAATRESDKILTELPDFALGHVTKATIAMIIDEPEVAREQLHAAEILEPALEIVPQMWAQLLASENKLDEALAKAQEGVRRRPGDPQPLFILARIERKAEREADMRTHAQQIVALTPESDRDRRRELLKRALGDNALDGPSDAWLPK